MDLALPPLTVGIASPDAARSRTGREWMRSVLLILCMASTASMGCAVGELHSDQDKIRTALLDLYTNQIIDSLIGAGSGMPIIQIDYQNASATITISETGSVSNSLSTTNIYPFAFIAVPSLAVAQSALNVL